MDPRPRPMTVYLDRGPERKLRPFSLSGLERGRLSPRMVSTVPQPWVPNSRGLHRPSLAWTEQRGTQDEQVVAMSDFGVIGPVLTALPQRSRGQ